MFSKKSNKLILWTETSPANFKYWLNEPYGYLFLFLIYQISLAEAQQLTLAPTPLPPAINFNDRYSSELCASTVAQWCNETSALLANNTLLQAASSYLVIDFNITAKNLAAMLDPCGLDLLKSFLQNQYAAVEDFIIGNETCLSQAFSDVKNISVVNQITNVTQNVCDALTLFNLNITTPCVQHQVRNALIPAAANSNNSIFNYFNPYGLGGIFATGLGFWAGYKCARRHKERNRIQNQSHYDESPSVTREIRYPPGTLVMHAVVESSTPNPNPIEEKMAAASEEAKDEAGNPRKIYTV